MNVTALSKSGLFNPLVLYSGSYMYTSGHLSFLKWTLFQ